MKKMWNGNSTEYKMVYNRFFSNIKCVCKEKGIKIGELERSVNISKGYLSRMRKEGKGITLANAYFLAKQIDIPLDDLLNKDISKERRIKELEEELAMLKNEVTA